MSFYFPELHDDFSRLLEDLKDRRVCVIGHARPDGDCIGSQVGLTRLLHGRGLDAFTANADKVPEPLAFLVEDTPIELLPPTELLDIPLVYVDCADEGRIGPKTSQALVNNERVANIDHHISNTNFAKVNIVDSESAATCEILAGLAFDLELPIDETTAAALYVGILTDTGRFSYGATTTRVFEICGRLVERGASPVLSARNLYESQPMERLMLLQRFLQSLELELEGRVCVGELRQIDFIETGANYADTEGFVDYARSVNGADVGLLVEERKTTTKGSLRGKDPSTRLDQIASQFGGGGHACAAGLSSDLSLEELKKGLIQALESRLNGMDSA